MSEKFPTNEHGRYTGKYPWEYPDHLNYLKGDVTIRARGGYTRTRNEKRRERTRPKVRLLKLMKAIEQIPAVTRTWYNVETNCAEWRGYRENRPGGMPVWIHAIIQSGIWIGAIIIENGDSNYIRNKKMYDALQLELDTREIPLLRLRDNQEILSLRFKISNWIDKEK